MSASQIAMALGNAHRSGEWWRCRCPVHGSRGATLALRDGERGLIAKCHFGCPRPEILAAVRRLGLFAGDNSASLVPVPSGTFRADDNAHRLDLARRIWDRAGDPRGTPAATYFAARGLSRTVPPSLRWAPALRRLDGSYGPGIVARIDDVDGRFVAVHRTWLCRDPSGAWRRRDRASLGPIRGGAVRLAPASEILMIAEGVETALAGMTATTTPAWAALSTSGMAALLLPPIVRHVIIMADNDRSGAGERAARSAAQHWLAEGRKVQIVVPGEIGFDINDVLIARTEAHHVAA